MGLEAQVVRWGQIEVPTVTEMSARVSTLEVVSTVEQPEEPVVRIYTPDEAIKRARPLPSRDRLVIKDVPDEEWAAFQAALAGT